jgi:Tol biopolymer transport system component
MTNPRILSVLILLTLLLGLIQTSLAQTVAAPVSIPVHGQYAFTGNLPGTRSGGNNNQLFLTDTYTGNTQLLTTDELFMGSPKWDRQGSQIAFLSGATTNIWEISNSQEITLPIDLLATPKSWSPDGTKLLYSSYDSSTIPATEALQVLDLPSSTSTALFSYQQGQVLDNVPLPPLPSEVTQLTLYEIRQADWNPVYPDWIVVQFIGFTSEVVLTDEGTGTLFPITFVYNLQTGQAQSLDQLFTTRVSGNPISWSPDGRYLVIQIEENSSVTAQLIAFEYDGQTWSLNAVESAPSGVQVVNGWIGAGDLLHSTVRDPDTGDSIHYIAQVINGTWYSTEFFRLPKSLFELTGEGDWYITASETEKQQLTCLFDQTLPIQLGVGVRGRVTFTDGTPSRLRAEPGIRSAEITQMAEGTEFDVIGGPICINGFRWWQLELDDTTTGWAAEADGAVYFLEPLIPPTPTPTLVPPGFGKIAYSSVVDVPLGQDTYQLSQIHVANVDGSNPVNISNVSYQTFQDLRNESDPTWSPDGYRVAVTSIPYNGDEIPQIVVMNADGSNRQQLTSGSANYDPSWSPDGSQIAFVSDRDGNPEIYIMNTDGTNPQRLTFDEASDTEPDWSPFGNALVFASNRVNGSQIFAMNPDGTNVTQLTNTASDSRSPAWSSDGRQITFVSYGSSGEELFIMYADGTNVESVKTLV